MRHHLSTLAVALWVAACGKSDSSSTTQAAAGDVTATQVAVLAPQDVAQATRSSISPTVVISGSLDPYKTVDVKAQVGGTITGLRAERGRPVARGERLAVIQAQGIQSQAAGARAQVAAAEAQVALAQRQLESTRKLYEAGASSEIDYRTAQAQYQSAQGQLAAARAQASGASESASHTTIAAPISGVVSARDVDEGEAVTAGAKLFTIVDPDTLELAGEIPVQSAAQVRAGQAVSFRLDAYPGQTFAGRVARVDPTADPNTRRVGASLYLPNPGRRIIGGQFVTGEVLSGAPAEDAVVVPRAAVRGGGDSSYVFVVENGKLARRAVSLGPRDVTRGLVSVLSGVREGETVIVSPSTDLVAGTPVRVAAAGGR
jgi:RND family efflux transporter MFP subunit